LQQVLIVLQDHCAGKLTAVFGCGGDRDVKKRPLMGKIAAQLSASVVLTNDNPRSEDPASIAADICAGISEKDKDHKVSVIFDRADAIATAINASGRGDCVLVAGKGHELDQVIGAEVKRFDDRQVVADVLAERAA